jgi:hypothetical protein
MSKTRKLLATTLASLSIVAVPATSVALNGAPSVSLACGASGSNTCG